MLKQLNENFETQKTRLTSPRPERSRAVDASPQKNCKSINSAMVLRALFKKLDADDSVMIGNSSVIRDAERALETWPDGMRISCSRGVNGIDGHLSTAAGIAASKSKGQTYLVCGDLTALHDLNGLLLAKEHHVKIVVLNNLGGRIFDRLPFATSTATFEKFFRTQSHINLTALAEGVGIDATTVSNQEELTKSLDTLLGSSCCMLLDVMVDHNVDEAWRDSLIGSGA